MSLSQEQRQFAKDIGLLLDYIYQEGYSCSLGEAFRTQQQAEIYAKEGIGIKDSLHCQRLALDINLFQPDGSLSKSKDYERFGCFWENLDSQNRWGGRFSGKSGPCADSDHFERKPRE